MPLSNSAGPSRAPMITNVKIAPDRLGVARGRWHAAHSIDPHCFRVCAWQRLNFLTAALRQYLPIIEFRLWPIASLGAMQRYVRSLGRTGSGWQSAKPTRLIQRRHPLPSIFDRPHCDWELKVVRPVWYI